MERPRPVHILIIASLCILPARGIRSQNIETRVDNAEVVYVGGNDVVLRLHNSDVKLFEIPASTLFMIDGKGVTLPELEPGMKLTATISTSSAPLEVDSVEIIKLGTVWKIVGGSLIIKRPGGENRIYRVPSGSTITLDGKEKSLDQLREGDRITATIIKTRVLPEVTKAAVHPLHAPSTPARVGALLIEEEVKPGEPPATWGTAATMTLIVVIVLVVFLLLWAFRHKRKAGPGK